MNYFILILFVLLVGCEPQPAMVMGGFYLVVALAFIFGLCWAAKDGRVNL